MYVTTNSALIWKRKADENSESAKLLGRLAVLLFVLLLAVGAYAFSARASLANVCETVAEKSQQSSAKALTELAILLASNECR